MLDLLKTPSSRRLAALAAVAGLSFVGAPALAQTVEEFTVYGRMEDGRPVTLSRVVSYRDLDITTPPGQDELKRRIQVAAREVCNELGEPSKAREIAGTSCRDRAERDAFEQMRVAVAQAVPRAPGWVAPAPAYAAAPPPPAPAPAAETYAEPVAATTRLVTNGPVPDTAENRARFGGPMSNAGQRTAPAGN